MSYSKPTAEQVEASIPLISSPQHEAYFFERLENPFWIEPLAKRKVFEYPPPPQPGEGGGVRFPRWPPSRYLARMASKAPKAVAEVFKGFSTTNSSVISNLVDAANAMPPECAASLAPAIVRATKGNALWLAFKDAAEVCVKLARGGHAQEALGLADALFTPSFEPGQDEPSKRDVYLYKEGLKAVAPALAVAAPDEHLTQLCQWLEAAIKAKGYVNLETGDDLSYSWRPVIESEGEYSDWDFAAALVEFVCIGFEAALDAGAITLDRALDILGSFPFTIYKRLRIHLIARYAEQNPEIARETMMDQSLFDDRRFKHEYAMLLEQRFRLLNENEQREWFGWIDAGPDMSDYDQMFESYHERAATEKDCQERIGYWQFEKLHWVRQYLTDERKSFYQRMLTAHGEPELADRNFRTRIGAGFESPMTVEDLEGKSFAEVVKIVTKWKPAQSQQHWGPSVEGLASTFSNFISVDPTLYSHDALLLKSAHPIFVRQFISQMAEAVKKGVEIDILAVLKLAEWVLTQPVDDKMTGGEKHRGLVDVDWHWTRDEIAAFIENICTAKADDHLRFAEADLREPMWRLLEPLCRGQAKSNILRDISADDPRLHDYLDLGINSSRGKALMAVLEYARWRANHRKTVEGGREVVPGGFDSMPEVRDMLNWQIDPPNRSIESMSVIGSRMGLLYWIDRGWLEEVSDRLFDLEGLERDPAATEGWAAWNAFLVWTPPHFEFYKIFRRQFAYAVNEAIKLRELKDEAKMQPVRRLGEHLVLLYGRGQLGLDDDCGLIRSFIQKAPPAIRRQTIGFVGRTIQNDESLPDEVIRRFQNLWELYWRGPGKQDAAESPNDWLFGHWFTSKQFPDKWALAKLLEFSKVVGVPEPDHLVAERLAELVEVDITTCLAVLGYMVHGDKEGWHIHSWIEPAKKILRSALRGSAKMREQASELINHLGRQGFIEFGELLTEPHMDRRRLDD